jgi:hypothetical protein
MKLTKKIIFIIILILSFQSFSKADDIRDFEIDGYSLNESLLNYYSKENLKANWKHEKNGYGFKSKKYFKFAFEIKDKGLYERKIIIYTLRKDKKYKIQSITAFAYYPNKIDKCYDAQLTLATEFERVFPNTKKEIFEYNNKHDPHGQSTEKDIVFIFDDGSEAGIACLDWGEKYTKQNNSEDHMQVFLDTKGYADWLKGPAYK